VIVAPRPREDRFGHNRAVSLFRDYVRATEHLAGPLGAVPLKDSAACVLQNRMSQAAEALEADVDTVLSQVVDLALARAEKRPPPIYIVGIGGSGSRWLAGMLAKALGAIDLEEASIPADFGARIESLPAEEQGLAIDCLHLGHASLALATRSSEQLRTARAINSAIPTIEPRHKRWDPECFAIYLLRDPRDQVACFAFRKPKFRSRAFPGASDEQYLVSCAGENARNHAAMRRSPVQPDFTCRFEELKESATDVLVRLADAIGRPVTGDAAARVAGEYDASLVRRGLVARKTNLSPTESNGWREETDERQKLILHSYLTEVVTATEYPADECLGRPLAPHVPRAGRRLSFDRNGDIGVLFVRGAGERGGATWARLGEARGEIALEPGVEVKLRVNEQAPTAAIRSLRTLTPDALDSLCMAGSANLDDELLGICTASLADLRELDLSRTAVTDRSVDSIASLSQLRGINLFGSNLTASGISKVHALLPAADV
jgi:hypothetical protein